MPATAIDQSIPRTRDVCENVPGTGAGEQAMSDTEPHIRDLPAPNTVLRQPPYTPTVPEMLRFVAREYADMDAIVRGNERLSYRELERRSATMARGLLAHGLGKGSRVALIMPDSPDFAIAFMAAARIGAVVLPMTTLYQAPEIRWVLNHADIDTLLTYDKYLNHDYIERLQTAFPDLAQHGGRELYLGDAPYLRRVFVWNRRDVPWAYSAPEDLLDRSAKADAIDDAFLTSVESNLSPADHLAMIYTSGSTADPKGVVHYHGAMMRHSYLFATEYYPYTPGERAVAIWPWFWVAGLATSLLICLQGGVCLIVPESNDAAHVADAIITENATLFSGMFDHVARVSHHLRARAGDLELFSVHVATAGIARRNGASGECRFLSENLERLVPARQMPVPAERIVRYYGMTETLAGHSGEPAPAFAPVGKEGTSGRPLPEVQRKVVDPETRQVLPPGEVGELCVRGFSLMAGLYKKERHETFDADGYYPSGDLCVIDEDDWLTFKARTGDMIKVSGANVAPLQVEQAMMSIDGVDSCAVVGLNRGTNDALLAAAVVPLPGRSVTETALITAMKPLLASYKIPKRVFIMSDSDIPRTANGKVRYFKLREQLEAQLGAEP